MALPALKNQRLVVMKKCRKSINCVMVGVSRTSTPWVLGIAEWVVLRRGLREPHVTTITTEMSALQRIGNILLDDNSATGSVDEP